MSQEREQKEREQKKQRVKWAAKGQARFPN